MSISEGQEALRERIVRLEADNATLLRAVDIEQKKYRQLLAEMDALAADNAMLRAVKNYLEHRRNRLAFSNGVLTGVLCIAVILLVIAWHP